MVRVDGVSMKIWWWVSVISSYSRSWENEVCEFNCNGGNVEVFDGVSVGMGVYFFRFFDIFCCGIGVVCC